MELLTMKETRTLLRMSKSALEAAIKRGDLPKPIRIGKIRKYEKGSLLRTIGLAA